MSQAPPVRYRESTLGDYDSISAMLERVGLHMVTRDEWETRWPENPARPMDSPGGAETRTGWLMETPDGRVVGFCGNIFSAYEMAGKPILAASAHALGVEAEYRSQTLPLLVRFFRQPGVQLLLSTTANERAAQVYGGFKAVRVPHPSYDQVLYWVTKSTGFASAALRAKKVRAASLLGAAAGPGLWLADRLRGRGVIRVSRPTHRARILNRFDERFDSFWEQLRKQWPGRLLAVRSSAAMKWHYRGAAARDELAIIGVDGPDDSLDGYAILVRRDSPAPIALRRYVIADLQIMREDPALVLALLGGAIETARAQGMHVVEAVGLEPFKRRVLESANPRVRRFPSWPYLYKAQSAELAKVLESPAVWDPCPYDGDAAF